MTETLQPIVPSYTPPDPALTARYRRYYIIYLVLTMIPTSFCLLALLLVIPHFRDIFMDFKTTLPPMTTALMNVSEFCQDGWWILILLAGLAIPLLPARWTYRREPHFNRVANVLIYFMVVFTATIAEWMLFFVILFLPLVKIIQSVAGGP